MAKITAARRHALPRSDFVFPDREAYPDDTIGRARNALSRGAQNASPAQLAKIKAKVHRDYPSIKISGSKGGYAPFHGGRDERMDHPGGYTPAQNRMFHAQDKHPRMHALSIGSANHLRNMGHITPEHHARIVQASDTAMANAKRVQPAMNPQQPAMQPFGSFAPPDTAGYG